MILIRLALLRTLQILSYSLSTIFVLHNEFVRDIYIFGKENLLHKVKHNFLIK